MKRISLLILMLPFTLLAEDQVAGIWLGTIEVANLRVQFHITPTADGHTVTMDSLDQNVTGIPAALRREGENFIIDVQAARASFSGTLDGDTWTGHWNQMGQSMPLTLTRQTETLAPENRNSKLAEQPHGVDLIGKWQGSLATGVVDLRLVLHVGREGDIFSATLDSPDQGAAGIGAAVILKPDRALTVEVPSAGARYDATLSADGQSLTGSWHQGPLNKPFTMERTEKDIETHRPQEPKPPFPYTAEEVQFPGGAEDVTLAGTLTMPKGEGPFPLAVLVSGSGPQNRDEELMGHKPFLVLADYLTRRGIAVLRYDDRGFGQSTGNHQAADSRDFAADAQAAVTFAKTRAAKVGLVGHSEGGLIAPLVARKTDLAFVVLMAGPAANGQEILLAQTQFMAESQGIDEKAFQAEMSSSRHIYETILAEPDPEKAAEALRPILSARIVGDEPSSAATVEAQISTFNSAWFRYFLIHNPLPALRALNCPALALFGGKDMQVSPKLNLEPMKQALAGKKDTQIKVFPNLNHLFQTCETGAPSEYYRIEETMAPEALKTIGDWIEQITQ